MEINKLIDHTLLAQDAAKDEIDKLCHEAKEYKFKTVCIQPYWVSYVKDLLSGSDVGITTVIGFPLGANTSQVKSNEAEKAIQDGADEIDMVMNVGALKSGMEREVLQDIQAVRKSSIGKTLKVILETSLLSEEEIRKASQIAKEAGADFIKTSTGFSSGGARVEDIRLMKQTVGPDMGVKASGGIRDFETAQAMIEAGADRIGASKSIEILQGSKK